MVLQNDEFYTDACVHKNQKRQILLVIKLSNLIISANKNGIWVQKNGEATDWTPLEKHWPISLLVKTLYT